MDNEISTVDESAPYLTEPEAWREIARRIQAGEWKRNGLCNEVHRLYAAGAIDGEIECEMRDRIDDVLVGSDDCDGYLFPRGDAQPRIELALRFAADAERNIALVSPALVSEW